MFPYSEYIYDAMYVVGFAIMMVYSIKMHSRYNVKKNRAIAMTIFTYFAGVAGALLMGKVFTAISESLGLLQFSTVAIFGAVMFTPLFLLLMFAVTEKILVAVKPSIWRDNMDLLTPGIFIILTCAKFGCAIGGCCYGIECETFAVYNPIAEKTVFPIQIFETVTMIAVILLANFLLKKKHIFPKGSAYPVYAIFYCITRFFWEFLRYYESDELRHLFLGMSLWQICSIIVIAVSIAVLLYLRSPSMQKNKKQKKK